MITLLETSPGSSHYWVEDPALSSADWATIKSTASGMLRSRGQMAAVELLDGHAWELRVGGNDFGDDFEVLYRPVNISEMVVIDEQVRSPQFRNIYQQIAGSLSALGHPVRFIGVELTSNEAPRPVAVPELLPTSQSVEHALNDAESLISAGRPESAVDRAHTALHGYLRSICLNNGLAAEDECESINQCLHHLRTKHPAFLGYGARDEHINHILRALFSVAGNLNSLRNTSSLAHPTDALLGKPEAMLCINTARTLLRFVHDKIAP